MSTSSIREIEVRTGRLAEERGDLLVVPCLQGARVLAPEVAAALGGAGSPAAVALASGDFRGEVGETLVVYGAGSGFLRTCLLGLGPAAERTREKTRAAWAAAARKARDLGAEHAVFALGLGDDAGSSLCEQAELVAEAAVLGTYRYTDYKTVDLQKYKSAGKLTLLLPVGAEAGAIEAAVRRSQVRAEGTNYARDLANTPANILTPTHLAERAETMAAESGLALEVWDRAAC